MPDAVEFLNQVEAKYRNTDIDWEELLEADYLTLLEGRQGLNVIDIGGHAGRHSQVINERLRPLNLVIFEPLPEQWRRLHDQFLPCPNVSVRNLALSKTPGRSAFVVKQGAPEESGLRQRSFYNDGDTTDLNQIQVEVETLDHLDLPFRVDFIKIDTEGGEIDIIHGGEKLLKRDAPIMSVEYGPGGYDAYGYQPETLFELATEIGYSLFDLFGNRFTSVDEWRSCVARFYWDFLLIPSARIQELTGQLAVIRSRAQARFG